MFRRSELEMRVVVLAPVGRDAALLARALFALEIDTVVAPDASSLVEIFAVGAGAAIIAEEALTPAALQGLRIWLSEQPPWSDMPFIVLTSSGVPTRESHFRAGELRALGNFTLIERPVRPDTVESSVRAALRARMRQYEIRSRQEALVQANADLEQFAHSASHDLREPLRTVGIYADLLARDYRSQLDERGIELLNLIGGSISRMDDLLSDLLSYAHASSIFGEDVQPSPSNRALEDALKNLEGSILESGAKISVAAAGMPMVRMRESHLSQIFQNLLGNAIKYRNQGCPPLIEISTRASGGHWIFTIADNGIGVPAAYQESIFGIFKRLHTTSKYSGTGMGLAICKRIVERYRGKIWVESESAEGARFSFSVPG
jgi:signal transduction histidine kinase